jgi:hypothetical protein
MKDEPRKKRRKKAPRDLAPGPVPRAAPAPGPAAVLCDLCGAEMFELHCRLICPRCGYQRDCSDP